MEPEVQQKIDAIWSLLHATAERENQMEKRASLMEERFNRRMDRTEESFNRRMDRAEQRMDRAEQRMDKSDRQLDAIKKLIQHGMKLLVRNEEDIKALTAEVRALARFRGGANGNGRSH